MDPNDQTAAIQSAAAGPQSVTVDGSTVTSQPIDGIIAADRYLAARAAAKLPHRGLRFQKISPPGTIPSGTR